MYTKKAFKPKVYLYVHDEKWFWHLSRMLKIYHAIKSKYSPCILIWWALEITDDTISHIRLPESTEFENKNDSKKEKSLKNKRKQYIESVLMGNEYSFLLIDYFPFWRHAFFDEMDSMINITHKKSWKVYTIMRDIFTWNKQREAQYYSDAFTRIKDHYYPKTYSEVVSNNQRRVYKYLSDNWYKHAAVNLFLKYYLSVWKIDNILVFWDKNIYDIRDEFFLTDREKEQFKFLWYIIPDREKEVHHPIEKPYILISPWWNIFNIKFFFELLSVCRSLKEVRFKVIVGNMIDNKLKHTIVSRFRSPNIEFINFQKNLSSLIFQSKWLIGWWWYWTFWDILWYRKKAIMFINHDDIVNINKTEQFIRIQHWEKIGNITYASQINHEIIKQILELYHSDDSSFPLQENIDVNGSTNILQFLCSQN